MGWTGVPLVSGWSGPGSPVRAPGERTSPLASSRPSEATITDLPSDGVAELIVGSYVDGDVYVYSGPLSGTQSLRGVSQQITGAGTSLADVGGVGDLDGDGVEDLGVGAEDRGGLRGEPGGGRLVEAHVQRVRGPDRGDDLE